MVSQATIKTDAAATAEDEADAAVARQRLKDIAENPEQLVSGDKLKAALAPKRRRRKAKARHRARKLVALTDTKGRPFPPAAKDVRNAGKQFVDKGGRPYAIKDNEHAIATLGALGAIMATSKECASVLGIDEVTLFAFFKRVPEAREAWEGGKQRGKSSLRRSQFALAEKNATMAIFLGMQYLDQKDKRAFSGDPDNPIKHQHAGTVTAKVKPDYSALSTDELVRLHSAKVGAARRD